MPQHSVEQGECLSSIAASYGFEWQTIWNDPNNAEFKAKRKDPNVLYPGDILFIPEKVAKTELRPTDASHKFVKGAITYLRLQILDWEKPRVGEEYVLDVAGKSSSGRTDGSGFLEEQIPATAAIAKLYLGPMREVIDIDIGTLDPISEVSGKQGRLNNLGYACPVNGTPDDRTKEAILLFQTDTNLPATGEFDAATEKKIQQLHGR
jgi:peptidoglycan hydrolase-like protein with peptidoglycan-binding domain